MKNKKQLSTMSTLHLHRGHESWPILFILESVRDYPANIVALTTLMSNTSSQTHYYRCTAYTLHPSLRFLLFSFAVSCCFRPPSHQSWEWLDQTSTCLLRTAQTQGNTKRHNARIITHAAVCIHKLGEMHVQLHYEKAEISFGFRGFFAAW